MDTINKENSTSDEALYVSRDPYAAINAGDVIYKINDEHVVRAMERFGGSFISALATAIRCADTHNLWKIKTTWPEYWAEYTHMAVIERENK